MIEYECRKLNIDIDEIVKKCEMIGANRKGEYWQKRLVYDFKPKEKGKWIRLRNNGSKTTLTIKEIESFKISGTKELEIEVSDFDNTASIMEKLGYYPRTFQENFRIEYVYDNVYIDIDKWPGIPPFIEIEGKDEKSVIKIIEFLGYSVDEFIVWDIDYIYLNYYGIRLDSINKLCFCEDEKKYIDTYRRNN